MTLPLLLPLYVLPPLPAEPLLQAIQPGDAHNLHRQLRRRQIVRVDPDGLRESGHE